VSDATPTGAKLLIAGRYVAGEGGHFALLDKYRRTQIGEIRLPGPGQVRAAVVAAHSAFRRGAPTPHERGRMLDRASSLIEGATNELVGLVQRDSGFTAADGHAEVQRCVETVRLAAMEARQLTGDVIPLAGAPGQAGRFGFTLRVPVGVVAAITPFNSPLNTVMHKIAPALAAGNPVVLKPSSATPLTAWRLTTLLLEAGVPSDFVSLLYGGANEVRTLLEQPEVRYIAFTGSTEVGRTLQQQAGLRRTQMELGSIAFTIVCPDANLDLALPKIINAAYRKAGQVCTSIQILLVHESLTAEVSERLAQLTRALPYGDPMSSDTVVGPLISEAAATRVEEWISEAIRGGARSLAGGPRQGSVVPPTLLTGVAPNARLSCQEAFGPVMSIEPFATLEEAIGRVNSTPYGLASGIFTNQLDAAFRAARQLEVGTVHVNETSSTRVDLMPYGGSKDSGFGREGPHYAVREMTEERMITFAGTG
jgi:acyl-CoA reductase-like NAD-dependent aldehyde dehydrogenase